MRIADEEGFLCGLCLDLTLYLPEAPGSKEAHAALEVFRRVCPRDELRMICSPNEEWIEFDRPIRDEDVAPYLARMDDRIDEGIWVWNGIEDGWSCLIRGVPPQEPEPVDEEISEQELDDDIDAEDENHYTEDELRVYPGLVDVASLCQIQLPSSCVDELLTIARALFQELSFISGHGGFAFAYDPWRKDDAFDQIYAWAKRFVGVDVHDLNRTLGPARHLVKSVNWLTLVGNRLLDELAARRQNYELPLEEGVVLEKGPYGVLIRAGATPQLGDRNKRKFPHLYAAVDHSLAPILMRHHPEFPGRFAEENATEAWFARFANPDAW